MVSDGPYYIFLTLSNLRYVFPELELDDAIASLLPLTLKVTVTDAHFRSEGAKVRQLWK